MPTMDVIRRIIWLCPKRSLEHALGVPVDSSTPAFPPRTLSITVVQPNQAQGTTFGENKLSYNDDIFMGWLGIGTQIDGLGHVGIDGVYYNGNKAADFAKAAGLTKLGIEKIPPLVARGVLLDMAGYKGVEMMKEGELITVADVEGAARAQGVTIQKGDVVIFHTGWLSLLGKDNQRYAAGEPGIGVEVAEYLAQKEVVAVGMDTWGIEAVPFPNPKRVWEAHQVLLAKNGIYILETLDTRELVKDKAWEFLFVLGQPLYRGAVQAIINPVAIR
ncbi:MAG: polyketide cyclase [Candidatus Tectimicrobiota bacterium]|nr:MAG: polyketide cyclase [Candidatus Tectomicrobia bacterium]